MTRRLGVRYIWIDSLCICQDDKQDWERESARMDSIYSNLYLTIAATGKPNTLVGYSSTAPGEPISARRSNQPAAAIAPTPTPSKATC